MKETIQNLFSQSKALVFDFDGTLVDSNKIKRKAFATCFANYSDQIKEIMVYCDQFNHTPRVVKFRHVFENILKLPYPPETEKQMLEGYAAETTEQVIATPEIPGATEFLKRVASKWELGLLSSTPHEFLLHILEQRGLKKYFRIVQGAPVDKRVWLKSFIASRGLTPNEILFFGDSIEDCLAAKGAEIPFVGVGMNADQTQYVIASFESLL